MLEQQKFRGDGACATRAEKFREDDKQVAREEEQIAHKSNGITPANLRKTTGESLFGLKFANSHPTAPAANRCRNWDFGITEATFGGSGTPGPKLLCGLPLL